MSRRTDPHESRAFAAHLALASGVFGALAVVLMGAVLFGRWAFRLELASSTTQGALEAARRLLALHETFWPVAAASLVALAAAAHWLGRRIAGPLPRFEEAFRAVSAGGVPAPVRVRTTDFVARELAALNAMLDALRGRRALRAEACAELRAALEELAEHAHRQRDATAANLVASALAQAKRLEDGGGGGV